ISFLTSSHHNPYGVSMSPFDTQQMSNSPCFVSRQAIFNPSMTVAAYDLQSNFASVAEPKPGSASEQDSIQALSQMFSESGLDMVIGDRPGLVTMTPTVLTAGLWKYVPPDRMMIGLSSSIEQEESAAHLTGIAAEGYGVVLDESLVSECTS